MDVAGLHQRILEVLARGATSIADLARNVRSGERVVLRIVRALERRGAVGLCRVTVDGEGTWLAWAPGDPARLLENATRSREPRGPDELGEHPDRDDATPSVWTLHAAGLAVKRPARREEDGFLSFFLGGRPEGLVHAGELALRGYAVSCASRARDWHPLVDVFDHPPTPAERATWLRTHRARHTALSDARSAVWILFPGEAHAREDRAVRCSTRRVRGTARGARRTDLEVRPPLRGFEGHVLDGLDLATRGFTSFRLGASSFVACAEPPDVETRARCASARTTRESASLRADAEAFLAPSRTRIGSPAEALVALGLPVSASATDVARAFRRRVVADQAHPDLGGSAHEFAELVRVRDLALSRR